jgi:hypothetical protein
MRHQGRDARAAGTAPAALSSTSSTEDTRSSCRTYCAVSIRTEQPAASAKIRGQAPRSRHHERSPHEERGARHAEDRQAEECDPARAAGRSRPGCVVIHAAIGNGGPLQWRMQFSHARDTRSPLHTPTAADLPRSTRTQPTPAGAARTVRGWVPRAFIVHVVRPHQGRLRRRSAVPAAPFDPQGHVGSGSSAACVPLRPTPRGSAGR